MTDKELKDWCKNCDVEPPAMRFKCPECEHNPDKEPIMIDDVDVSKCLRFVPRYMEDYDIDTLNYCGYHYKPCEKVDIKHCYFKQLARKTQECEELKERIKCNCFGPKSNNNRCISYNRIAEDYERDLKRLENKIAECEKYEQLFDELDKRVSNCIEIYDCTIVSKIVKDIISKAKE